MVAIVEANKQGIEYIHAISNENVINIKTEI